MQRNSNPFRRDVFLVALTMACASCNSDPAMLAELSGDTAKRSAELQFAEPVLVAGADYGVVAVVFSEDPADIPGLFERLLVPEVEGCAREGLFGRAGPVQCCDRATGTFVVNTERGWIRTGESCAAVAADERPTTREVDPASTYDDPEEAGIEFVELDQEFSQLLVDRLGIDYRLIQLAEPDGRGRALVNVAVPGPTPLASPAMQRSSEPQGGPQVILAGHRPGYPTPSGGCVPSIARADRCSLGGEAWCRKRYNHVYYKEESSGDWCEFRTTCSC